MFRHHQNASLNKDDGDTTGNRGNLRGFYSYKNTFDEDSVWLEIPKQGAHMDLGLEVIWLADLRWCVYV